LLLGASANGAEDSRARRSSARRERTSELAGTGNAGLARLRLGRKQEALDAFRGREPPARSPPGVLAVRAAILAANGYEDGARNDALLLGANRFWPEDAR